MYSEEKEKKFQKRLKRLIDTRYETHKDAQSWDHVQSRFFINLYNGKLKDKTGGQMEYYLQSLEANFVSYPIVYQRFIEGFNDDASNPRYLDMVTVKLLIDLFREVRELKRNVYGG